MKVLLDPNDVVQVVVRDTQGRVWPSTDGRPRPHCAECRREVDDVAGVTVHNALVYVARCHGEADVVRFVQEDGFLMALPVFSASSESRRVLLAWLAAGAIEDPDM